MREILRAEWSWGGAEKYIDQGRMGGSHTIFYSAMPVAHVRNTFLTHRKSTVQKGNGYEVKSDLQFPISHRAC